MFFREFGGKDVFINTMKAHASCEFFIYDGVTYYNDTPNQEGTFGSINSGYAQSTTASGGDYPVYTAPVNNIRNVPPGYISLYEYNIDRPEIKSTSSVDGGINVVGTSSLVNNNRIYPWISKDGARTSFRTVIGNVDNEAYQNEFIFGDILTAEYPLKASITREFIVNPSSSAATTPAEEAGAYNKHFASLKNRLNYYGMKSEHYKVSSSFGDKNSQTINMISIPSIFYGSAIKAGSLSLRWYVSGTLKGELKDERLNGELIQIGPSGSVGSGSVAGVALYEEGFILLTGSWDLEGQPYYLGKNDAGSVSASAPSWIYFAAGCNDGSGSALSEADSDADSLYASASFGLSFQATTTTQVVTMFAHAKRGEVNYSNNPTFLEYGQEKTLFTSSHVYEESPDIIIKNTVSSSWVNHSASFRRQVYVSRIGVYDKNRNLIGIATLADPVLKKENEAITFKLKLDI